MSRLVNDIPPRHPMRSRKTSAPATTEQVRAGGLLPVRDAVEKMRRGLSLVRRSP